MDSNRLAAVEEPLKDLVGFTCMRAKAGYATSDESLQGRKNGALSARQLGAFELGLGREAR